MFFVIHHINFCYGLKKLPDHFKEPEKCDATVAHPGISEGSQWPRSVRNLVNLVSLSYMKV